MAVQSLTTTPTTNPFLTKSKSATLSFTSKCNDSLVVVGIGGQRRRTPILCATNNNSSSSSNRAGSKAFKYIKPPLSSNESSSSSKKSGGGGAVPNSNYVVPLDKSFTSTNSSCITRPLVEILRDLNKRIPDNIIKSSDDDHTSFATFIPWYHANRMLSFYAPGWCGEIRDVIFSDNGGVTVVYRVTIRGSDGEAYRESTGTVSPGDGHIVDPVAEAEEIAFCRACARFGLGLYLYHKE